MRKIYSAVNSENELIKLLVVGKYYDYQLIGANVKGCQKFCGREQNGDLRFFDQFAHDGFGGIDTIRPAMIVKVWE